MMKGGQKKFCGTGSFSVEALSFSHTEGGGTRSVHSLKLKGRRGVQKVSDTQFSHFVAPRTLETAGIGLGPRDA